MCGTMWYICYMVTQSVRIDKAIVKRIKRQVKTSRQPVSQYINLVLDHFLTQAENDMEVIGQLSPSSRMILMDPKAKKWIADKTARP
jgi:hypothetical protein